MLDLSQAAILEKQKLQGDGAWLILLEIAIPTVETIYICRNTENVVWDSITWIAFPFELDDLKEDSKGGIPELTLRVSNVTRALQNYLEAIGGGVGSKVTFRVVHSNHLDILTPEIMEEFTIQHVTTDQEWVVFTLGAGDPIMKRFPPRRYLRNFCPFKYKGIECASTSVLTTCNKTLTNCRERNNSTRFGGFPTLSQNGFYK